MTQSQAARLALQVAQMTSDKSRLLARSWTAVAERYDRYVKGCTRTAKYTAIASIASPVTTRDRELVPRFAPYTRRLLSLLTHKPLPPGLVYVPACGPGASSRLACFALVWWRSVTCCSAAGHELVLLGQALPGRELHGVDLAAGMVALAEEKLAAAGLRCADGACTEPGLALRSCQWT